MVLSVKLKQKNEITGRELDTVASSHHTWSSMHMCPSYNVRVKHRYFVYTQCAQYKEVKSQNTASEKKTQLELDSQKASFRKDEA